MGGARVAEARAFGVLLPTTRANRHKDEARASTHTGLANSNTEPTRQRNSLDTPGAAARRYGLTTVEPERVTRSRSP